LESLRVALGGKQAKHFPYDWRSDIDALTDDFQSWAIANLSGKRVVLVAHSTGGLVVWNWKNRYLRDDQTDDPKKRRPFQLAGVILLGVPLKGSCEPVRMLIDGYSSPGSSSSWDQMATHFVFRNSRSAVFTFPSLFQLMPQYENDASACLGVVDQNGTHPLNHHEVGAWFGDPAGTFGVRRKFPDVAFEQTMKAPLDAYYEQVLKAIDRGKKFRDAFDYDGNEDSVAMFYTADFKMPSAYYYTLDNTWLRPANRSAQSLNGDGRVPEESGSNPGIKNPLFVSRFKTHSEHGALLQDKVFLNFAEDTLKKWLVQVKNLEKYALAIEVEEHRAYARRQKWVMRPVSQFSRLTETDPALAGAVSAVANLNIETIAGTGSEDRIARAKSVAKEFDGKDPTSSVAAAIYSSVEAIAPEENDARSLNRLGLIRFRQARYKEAERYLRRASEIAESKEDPYLTAAIKGQIYYSLGRAREQIKGMEDDARIAFGKSAELGNAEARQRMAR
jgi:pimeloyl-ACP methyl ester carboxylesterase